MISSRENAVYRVWMNKLLKAVLSNEKVARDIRFKGGSCAMMLGYLDRFSVDLDFDLVVEVSEELKDQLQKIFKDLKLEVKDCSRQWLHYVLKYPNVENKRNTLRLEITTGPSVENRYEKKFIAEVARYAWCHCRETMVANKLVAPMNRFEKHGVVVGRDIYDIHYFLTNGFGYRGEIIEERTGLKLRDFFKKLHKFVEVKLTNRIIDEDLNYLLSAERFGQIRKVLKEEVLTLLKWEIERVKKEGGEQ